MSLLMCIQSSAACLVTRKANDKRTVMELTSILRKMRPEDPVVYDFALFGIGIGDKYLKPQI